MDWHLFVSTQIPCDFLFFPPAYHLTLDYHTENAEIKDSKIITLSLRPPGVWHRGRDRIRLSCRKTNGDRSPLWIFVCNRECLTIQAIAISCSNRVK
jgi:hypothetical protein